MLQHNLHLRGFDIVINNMNINENRTLLFKLIKEEENYQSSERWVKANPLIKDFKRMAVDILHYQKILLENYLHYYLERHIKFVMVTKHLLKRCVNILRN